jgi:hypothetical protein
MIRYQFTCTFLEDVVLNARTATEGGSECLDFIPGSNFLGIAARSYDEFKEEGIAYKVFHSGNFRFGDAHPYLNGERAIRVPASWFHIKGQQLNESPVWVHGCIPESQLNQHKIDSVQLKQARSGFFLPHEGSMIEAAKVFTLKSAQDRDTRRAEEGKLFGYTALKRGSEWCFHLECDDEAIGDRIASILKGIHHIGRSRTAQYGTAQVELISVEQVLPVSEMLEGEILMYAESRLALFDEFCQPASIPTPRSLKLPEGSRILQEKSQIRSYTYAPWNYKRKCRDADRVCVEKGSVIAVELRESITADIFRQGIGSFRSEGLGKIIVNPDFLKADVTGMLSCIKLKYKCEMIESDKSFYSFDSSESDTHQEKWLEERKQRQEIEASILTDVNEFVKVKGNYFKGNVTPSQWGQIRSIASASESFQELEVLLFKEPEKSGKEGRKEQSYDRHKAGLLAHGKSAEAWKKRVKGKELRLILRENLSEKKVIEYGPIYVVRLAAALQAYCRASSEKGRRL